MTRLEKFYRETVAGDLQKQFSYSSPMQVPRVTKITLNMGIGEASQDKKIVEHATHDLTLIAGQKPVVTLAKKAIAGFKLREGMPIGCKVTLRSLEGERVRRDAVEEPAIVGDHHDAAREGQQRVFESPQGIDVQIVGGLVQQQQVAPPALPAWTVGTHARFPRPRPSAGFFVSTGSYPLRWSQPRGGSSEISSPSTSSIPERRWIRPIQRQPRSAGGFTSSGKLNSST